MYLLGLGASPFLDPPEGFHAAVAQSMRDSGDFLPLAAQLPLDDWLGNH